MRVKIAAASLLALSLVVPVLVCGGPAFARGGGGHGGGGGGGHIGGGHIGGGHIGGGHVGGTHIAGGHIGGAHISGRAIHTSGIHYATHYGLPAHAFRYTREPRINPGVYAYHHHFHHIYEWPVNNNIVPWPNAGTNYATIGPPRPLPKIEVKNYAWSGARIPRI